MKAHAPAVLALASVLCVCSPGAWPASVSPPVIELGPRGVGQTILRAPEGGGPGRLWSAELIDESEVPAAAAGLSVPGGWTAAPASALPAPASPGMASPPFFTLAPGGQQVIRVRLPAGSAPMRLLLRQQPSPPALGLGAESSPQSSPQSQVRLQLILPVRPAAVAAGPSRP